MSELSFLEKLLDGVDVDYKPLVKVCDFKNGFAFKSALFKEAGLPIIRITNVDGKTINLSDVKYFNPTDYKENTESYKIKYGDILIAMSGASTGKIGFYAHEDFAYLNQRLGKFLPKKNKLKNRYLYHYLLSKIETIHVMACGGAQPNLSSNELMTKFKIPIPCPDNPEKSLKIQAEIVRILDTFTELTTELNTELGLRKKQYSYYREQLLSFEEGEVEWKPLGDLGELVRGSGLPKADFTESGVPAIHYGQIYTYYGLSTNTTISFVSHVSAKKLKKVNTGDVVITNTSENIKDVGKSVVYLGKEQAVTGGHATIFKPGASITGKFFAYYAQTVMFEKQKRRLAKGTKVIDVSAKDMAKITIPIPSIALQNRITDILDKFDTLTNSISEGLPREIELRQKQYEYYRDMLFSFPKPKPK